MLSSSRSLDGGLVASAAAGQTLAFDPRNLEIKTKSIEQTLVPLVSQVGVSGFMQGLKTAGLGRIRTSFLDAVLQSALPCFVDLGQREMGVLHYT